MEDLKINEVGDVITKVRFHIKDLDHEMFYPQSFETFEEAMKELNVEYTKRNKGDGHDEYWQRRRTGIVKITTTSEIIHSNRN